PLFSFYRFPMWLFAARAVSTSFHLVPFVLPIVRAHAPFRKAIVRVFSVVRFLPSAVSLLWRSFLFSFPLLQVKLFSSRFPLPNRKVRFRSLPFCRVLD